MVAQGLARAQLPQKISGHRPPVRAEGAAVAPVRAEVSAPVRGCRAASAAWAVELADRQAAQPPVNQSAVHRRLITPTEILQVVLQLEDPMAVEPQSENPMAEGLSKVKKNPVLAAEPRLQVLQV